MKFVQTCVLLFVTFLSSNAQVLPVHEEPLHVPVFRNEWVRILDIQAQPGDTSLVHGHFNNYCYITLKGGDLWLDEEGQDPRFAKLPDAYIGGKYEIGKEPFVHRFANLSNGLIRFIAIEYMAKQAPNEEPFQYISMDGEIVVLDNNFFRASKISIPALASFSIEFPQNAVIVSLQQNDILLTQNGENYALDDWSWVPAKEILIFENREIERVELVLVFVK